MTAMALARADVPPLSKEAQAWEEARIAAIAEAEPAIACVLISRSDEYSRLGEPPSPEGSGKLGRFRMPKIVDPAADRAEYERLKRLDLSDPVTVPDSYGSGVVIDENGLILTNEHVVRGATKIFVRLPGDKSSYADIHAADPRSDLAVLRLLDPPGRLKAIKLGDGSKVRKGQTAISLANPYAAGFRDGSPSASWGIISNIRRRPAGSSNELERIKPLYQHGILLQVDLKLNAGCSGGALIDLKGELIGLTTAMAAITGSDTPGGYALPIDAGMKRIIEVLKSGREVEYGFLGVELDPRHVPDGNGIPINGTVVASPAYHKGLQPRDILVSINGTPINDFDDLFLTVSTLLAGGEARLEIIRPPAVNTRTIVLNLDKFFVPGKIIAAEKPAPVRGLRVDYLSVLMQSLHPLARPQGINHGVIVREVQNGSSAAQALLKVNDIITHVRGQPVANPADFYRRMQNLTGPVDITLGGTHQVKLN
jgi:S1-C subfamily serine protease